MGLLIESKAYREALLSRNIYRDGVEYELSNPFDGSAIARRFIPDYSSISSLAQNILYATPLGRTALVKLGEQLLLRKAQEAFDEIIPLSIDAYGGPFPQPIRKEDMKITKSPNRTLLDRVLNTDSVSDVFTNEDFRAAGTQYFDDLLYENTGKLQRLYFERNLKENFYSNRAKLQEKDQGTLFHYLERRLSNIAGDYYSDLVYSKPNADDIRLSQYTYVKKIDDPAYPISGILTDPSKEEILKKDGEFGDYGIPSLKQGDCFIDYTMLDTYAIDQQMQSADPNATIVWGVTPIATIENTFGAKRGLLRFTAEIAEMQNRTGAAINQSSKCYTGINGEVVYKANPCRNWTRIEAYGQVSTLIRSKGNGRPNSVNSDFVIPKIYPNGKEDGKNRYMFAIENLAWTKDDLIANQIPECEWGDMGGRLMWFPPYIESVDESASAGWNDVSFVGRVEPMPVHNGTSRRTGSMSFFLIMDYPQYMDESIVTPSNVANYIMCDENGIPSITFGGNTVIDLGVPDLVVDPIPDPVQGSVVVTGTTVTDISIPNVNYYFENDRYAYVTDYEIYASNGTVSTNLFALNAPFFGLPAGNTSPSTVPSQQSSFFGRLFDLASQQDVGSYLYRYFYDAIFQGNASEVFRGNQTKPSIYNVYLSFRRVFTLSKKSASVVSPSSSFRLNEAESSLSAKTKTVLQKLFSVNSVGGLNLSSFEPDKMFPYDSAYSKSIRKYYFDIDDRFVFDEYDSNGKKGMKFLLTARGSQGSGAGTGVRETRINLRPQKEGRNVLINVVRNASRVNSPDPTAQIPDPSQVSPSQGNNQTQNPPAQGQSGQSQSNTVTISPPCSDRFKDDFRNATYDMISQRHGFSKLKYFARAFHSQTPEDYHRRLTFLHQLLRMGRSIAKEGAENSSFGKAPIAILRVGDFFHTRVAITNINFAHGSGDLIWDLNGEGMGVQPMWTKVTMQYTIIGGESLAGPIDRLQNAVSFNYYANSTYYDSGVYASAVSQEKDQIRIDEERRKARK